MADIKLVIDSSDLSLLNEELNDTEKKVSLTAKAAERDFKRLMRSIAPLETAQQKYNNQVKVLQKAQIAGVISTNRYKSSLEQLNASVESATSSTSRLAAAQAQTKRSSNQLGVAVQQTGYQVGDFLIQIQSGTNAFVAFGQQATQLVGILPMVAKQLGLTLGAAIGLSTGLGIIIPIATAIGAAWSRSADSAKKLEDKIKPLNEALKDFQEEVKSSEESVVSWAGAMADINASKIVRAWSKVGKDASAAFEAGFLQTAGAFLVSNLWTGFETASEIKARLLAENFASAFGKAGEIMLEGALDGIVKAIDNKDVQALDDIIMGLSGISNISPLGEGFLETLINIRDEADGITRGVKSAMLSLQDALKYGKSIEDLKLDLNQEELTRLAKLYSEYYGVSLETATKLVRRATKLTGEEKKMLAVRQATLATYFLQQNVFEEDLAMQQSLQAQYLTSEQIQSAINKANEEHFSKVNNLRLISLEAQIKGRDMSRDELTIMQGLGDAVNKVILSYKELDGIISFGGGQEQITAGGRGTVIEKRSEAIFRRMGGLTGNAPSLRSKKPTTMEGPIKALKRQIELSKALFGLEGDARREQEVYMQLKFQNQDADIKAKESQLRSLSELVAEEERRTRVFEEQREVQKEVADTIANSMGDALMSMVDGTKSVKDAFKSMAAEIIKELYRIYVVKQITGMISGAIMGPAAAGGYFGPAGGIGGGSGATIAYADGGVVGSPTTFPMAGGRTGLMGEAGPEAIMPLKRGKDGKLGVQAEGGAGDVIIHQNFNFQANGDESVKKIIAQQAPAIANMTKKQILDDRRRGGQMKQAFG